MYELCDKCINVGGRSRAVNVLERCKGVSYLPAGLLPNKCCDGTLNPNARNPFLCRYWISERLLPRGMQVRNPFADKAEAK